MPETPSADEQGWLLDLMAGIIKAMTAIAVAHVRTDDPLVKDELESAVDTLNNTRRSIHGRYHGASYEELERRTK